MYCKTRDLSVVRAWIEAHNAAPAIVKDTDILKIKFSDDCEFCNCCDDSIEVISWENFCAIFEQLNLFFLYEAQEDSEFYKIILDPYSNLQDLQN